MENENIVLSTRIRLARNINNKPFPHKADENLGREIVKEVENAFYSNISDKKKYKTIYMWNNTPTQNMAYFEQHLISDKLIQNANKSAFILDEDRTVSLMINEEDHIRLQCMELGLNVEKVYKKANDLDDMIEKSLEYAFDEELGYLTACPTNIGTGLRASIMIHLPALSMNEEIMELFKALQQIGMTIRGIYGEGSKARGNMYQISNQLTLGVTEEEIVNNLNAVITQVVNQEMIAREKIITNYKYELEDRIFRAVGILKNAVLINSSECINLLSDVRLGVEMGIIKDVDLEKITSLIVDVQSANLQQVFNSKLDDRNRDYYRAKLVREKLK